MAPDPHVVAAAAVAGPWQLDALVERLAAHAGWGGPDEIGLVAAGLLRRWVRPPRGRPQRLAAEVADLLGERLRRRHVVTDEPPAPQWRWPVAAWTGFDDLARGLDLRPGELDWFADTGGWLRRAPDGPLHHYRRRWVPSTSGARLLESPGPRLAELQRRVGRRVLARIPVHDAAHGYVRGRSPHTLAAAHAGRGMVVRMDLEGFFAHVTGARTAGLLRVAGYPPAVAVALAGLLVTAAPPAVLRAAPPGDDARRRLLQRLAAPHLPQGAPTSPAVANLLAHRLDRRLHGLAAAVGARYGRYADDLVFSGVAGLPVHGLVARVGAIATEEGFRVRPDKTRVQPAHHRQRVTGLVVNADPAPARADYDALRALLHNCARTGPDAQNRAAHPAFRDHLLGRIAWVGSGRPARAARLRALFDAIDF